MPTHESIIYPASGHFQQTSAIPRRAHELHYVQCSGIKEGCLGYEKSSGFEAVTNFVVTVGGYVVDDFEDVPMGYILIVEMEAFGDEQRVQNNMK